METIRMIVKSILVVIMLASFLEIILPRSEMKRYINLIIGLFIIISILNPVLDLANKDVAFDVFDNISGSTEETNTIINKGKAFSQEQKEIAAKNYKDKLSKQIMGLSGLYQGTGAGQAAVEMVEDPTDPNFGQIKKIILYMSDKNKKSEIGSQVNGEKNTQDSIKTPSTIQVEEITVNRDGSAGEESTKAESGNGNGTLKNNDTLKNAIANFYGIDINQVEIRK